jgi:hydrogenase expression/formation protein HypD
MMDLSRVIEYLKDYDGRPLKIMEVCGTHTSSIFKNGIRSLISPKIKLISGPGCPVCVTPAAYIDKLIEYSLKPNYAVLTFGDMLKVKGSNLSLLQVSAEGGNVIMVYSPLEALMLAEKNPQITYIVAAVGFETTAPSYGLLMQSIIQRGIQNILLLTAIKTIFEPLKWICQNEPSIDGFLSPGHVSVITGAEIYNTLASEFKRPFTIAGFEGEHILAAIYDLVRQIENRKNEVHNIYTNAVRPCGNSKAKEIINAYFEAGSSVWRGIGNIENSGLYIKPEYSYLDAGSFGLDFDYVSSMGCRCGEVICGRINPDECPLFGKLCSPQNPQGPCMVSTEGACGIWHANKR